MTQQNRRASPVWLTVMLLVAVAAAMFGAARQLAAGAYHAYVINSDLTAPGRDTLEAARLATRLAPGDASYWLLRSYVERAQGDDGAGLDSMHRALVASPGWPHTWSAIARYWVREGDMGGRALIALRRSQSLGPHERSVHYANAVTGVDHWYTLPPDLREQVELSIVYALTHESYKSMHGYMGARDRVHLYCRRFAQRAGGQDWCRERGLPTGNGEGS